MVAITFIEYNGTAHQVEGPEGATAMETAVRNGVPGIVAECGGACACATCHVYVTPPEGVVLPQIGPGEARMLATSRHRTLSSRLSCQLKLEPALERMHVVIAPDDGGDF